MIKQSVYSIGYGNRKIEDFLQILREFQIEYLIDVRSKPFSKFNPQFNQHELKQFLTNNGITYVYMGDSVGGIPNDTSCYTEDGKIDYELVKSKELFKKGIERIKTACVKNISTVLMCAESKPHHCHRTKLIGRFLVNEQINLLHIDDKKRVKTQLEVINELNKGRPDTSLFDLQWK